MGGSQALKRMSITQRQVSIKKMSMPPTVDALLVDTQLWSGQQRLACMMPHSSR